MRDQMRASCFKGIEYIILQKEESEIKGTIYILVLNVGQQICKMALRLAEAGTV
jgi:hypothetical protein